MKKYQLTIRYPQHTQPEDAQTFHDLDALDVESRFDAIQWAQQLVRQLQLESHDTQFYVKDTETGLELDLYLKAYADSAQLNFKIETNIVIEKSHKNLFGLLTIKSKERVSFQSVTLEKTREYLSQFLSGYLLLIQEDFKQSKDKTNKA